MTTTQDINDLFAFTCTHLWLIWIVYSNPFLEESVNIAVMQPKQGVVWSWHTFTKWFTKYSVYLKQVERLFSRCIFIQKSLQHSRIYWWDGNVWIYSNSVPFWRVPTSTNHLITWLTLPINIPNISPPHPTKINWNVAKIFRGRF